MNIKLSKKDYLRYYRITIIFVILSIFCFTNGFTFENFEYPIYIIGIVSLIFSLIFFIVLKNKLRIIYTNYKFNTLEITNKILINISNKKNWEIIFNNRNLIIIETLENKIRQNLILTPNPNQRIYIYLKPNGYLVKSIYNLDNSSLLAANNGQVEANERTITNWIKR